MVALALLAASATTCGARVGPYLGAQASLDQGANRSSATGTHASGSSGGPKTGTTAATPGGAPAAGTATTPGGGAAAAQGPPTPSAPAGIDPRAEAAACAGAAGNTASAPGVTPNAVTLGNVSGLTGPLPDSFNQGAEAVQALFDAVNAAGGICGRQLKVAVEDDQQDSSTNAADVRDLTGKVLAFVGSTSDADNGGVPAMVSDGTPDFGFAINCNRSEASVYWSPTGGSCAQPHGPNGPYFINNSGFLLAKDAGYFPTKAAFLAYSIAISAQAAQQFEYVYQHMGGTVCYTDFSISPATASLESDVAQMHANGCNGIVTTLDVIGNAKLLQAMGQQAYTTPYTYTTFDGYTPAQISTAGRSASQGLTVGLPFTPLNESNPAVQMYLQDLHSYEPGKAPSGFGFMAWEAAQMFITCLIAAGHNPTRASIAQAAGSLTNWTGGGALGPYTPRSRGVAPCQVDVIVKGGDFVRRAPGSGLFCGGQLVQASP